MKDKLVASQAVTPAAYVPIHDGPHDAVAWCSKPWRLSLSSIVDNADYAEVPANTLVPLTPGVLSHCRTESENGRVSKIVTRIGEG